MISECLIAVGIVIGILLLLLVGQRGIDDRFTEKWPAISDDEFVRRCGPGTDRDIALKVRRIVSKQLGVPYDHIYPEQNFVNDLDCD